MILHHRRLDFLSLFVLAAAAIISLHDDKDCCAHAFSVQSSSSLLQQRRSSCLQKPSTSPFAGYIQLHPEEFSTALFYRAHDADDDESALIKVQQRTPVGYDAKQILKEQQEEELPYSAMNKRLITALMYNQGLILALGVAIAAATLFWNQGAGAFSNLDELLRWTGQEGPGIFDFMPTLDRVGLGLAGALPMLAFSSLIENSDKPALQNINFSTILMVMTLFGRRTAPPDEFVPDKFKGKIPTSKNSQVLAQSFALASVTGVCEEIVFRRLAPAVIAVATQSVPAAFIGQTALFGLGHMQPSSTLQENVIVGSLQAINGLFLGGIYLATGDLLPCIVAHAAFDFIQFFKTWSDANAQLEYAERMYLEPLPGDQEVQARALLTRASKGVKMSPRMYEIIKRLFYTFDFDKNKTLNLSEVRKGISYMALEQGAKPPAQVLVDQYFNDTLAASGTGQNRLDFPDFVRLYAILAKNSMESRSKSNQQQSGPMAQA